jgi:hypothetical protein
MQLGDKAYDTELWKAISNGFGCRENSSVKCGG